MKFLFLIVCYSVFRISKFIINVDWINKCSFYMNVECSLIVDFSYKIEGKKIWLIVNLNN